MPFWGSKSSQTPAESDASSNDASAPQNDPVASASQAAGTAWLAGHLHHLTDEQEKKLEDFKKLCEEKGYYKPEREGEKASHDDATMLYVPSSSGLPYHHPQYFVQPHGKETNMLFS